MFKETTKPVAVVQKTKFRFLYKMRSVKVHYCCVESLNNKPKNWENVYFGCEKLNSWPQPFARWKRGKTCNLPIIYHLSLPLKYELNTRCYITRQHGWNENIRRQPLGIAGPCINTGGRLVVSTEIFKPLCVSISVVESKKLIRIFGSDISLRCALYLKRRRQNVLIGTERAG